MSYVQVKSFDNYIYAQILLLRLKDAGIDCHLKDENTITIDPLLSPMIGGIKLMVAAHDIRQTTDILLEFELQYLQEAPCPNCGQKKIQRIVKSPASKNFLQAFFSRLINGADDSPKIEYKCSSCGFVIDDISLLATDN